jgi:arylsulfatase A-like enzyme
MKNAFLVSLGLVTFFACASWSAYADANRPNIIYILADDLGIGEVGCYGQEKIQTPHIDQLAAEGMRFTQHYSGAAVCAPSRFTLITGLHIGKSDTYSQAQRLKPDAQTLPKLMQAAGYTTGAFGKWGLGNDPNAQGIDDWYGFIDQTYAHYHYPERIWKNTKQIEIPENYGLRKNGHYGDISQGVFIHDEFTRNAMRFIEENQKSSIFLYLPYTIPHLEFVVPKDSLEQYLGKWPEKPVPPFKGNFYDDFGYCATDAPLATRAAMISRMDRDIGAIMQQLKELGLDNNTLVIFASDNGVLPDKGGNDVDFFDGNGPYRETKFTYYEGGIRVPMIARWPGKIQEGAVSDHISYFPDMLPTFTDLAGTRPTRPTDGISILPTLLEKGTQEQHDFLFFSNALRMDDWKLVRGKENDELFNLARDVGETTDVSGRYPEVLDRLIKLWEANQIRE